MIFPISVICSYFFSTNAQNTTKLQPNFNFFTIVLHERYFFSKLNLNFSTVSSSKFLGGVVSTTSGDC